jgi:hypothetical protein
MTVSLLVEIPEELHDRLKAYLETNQRLDQDSAFTAALSLLLVQNTGDRLASRTYLDLMFAKRASA